MYEYNFQNNAIDFILFVWLAYVVRQNLYTRCTQRGLSVTLDTVHGLNGSFYANLCSDVFGEQYNQEFLVDATRSLNIMFGGQTPRTSQVIYTNGLLDTWSPLGVTEIPTNINSLLINIPGNSFWNI